MTAGSIERTSARLKGQNAMFRLITLHGSPRGLEIEPWKLLKDD